MQNIQKTREMLAQIGAACVQITLGCEQAQAEQDSVQLFLGVQELEYALGEMHANAVKLRESGMSSTIDPALDHDADTQPANERPPAPPTFMCFGCTREVYELGPGELCRDCTELAACPFVRVRP